MIVWRILDGKLRRLARRFQLALRAIWLPLTTRRIRVSAADRSDEVRKVLSIRLDRLGDLILTLPALDDLAAAYPDAIQLVMVRPALIPLLRGRQGVDQVIGVPAGEDAEKLAWRMAAHGADLAVDFSAPDEVLAARALHMARIPRRVGFRGGGRSHFLTDAVSTPAGTLSLTQWHAVLVRAAGALPRDRTPRIDVATRDTLDAEHRLRTMGVSAASPRIAIHPGGFYRSQRWPLERFALAANRLADRYGAHVVLLGGPGDSTLLDRLEPQLIAPVVRVAPSDLRVLAAVMGCCDLMLCNNSGPLHLAAAVGLPTVSTMGPTDPQLFWPQGAHQAVLRETGLACSPCTRGNCAAHDCLAAIDVDSMVETACRVWEESRYAQREEVAG